MLFELNDHPPSPPQDTTASPLAIRNRMMAILFYIEFYLFVTLAVFVFGPVRWHVDNWGTLILFVFLNYLFLGVGYRWGVNRFIRNRSKESCVSTEAMQGDIPVRMKRLFYFSGFFAIFSWISMIVIVHGGVNFQRLLSGSLGENYFSALERMTSVEQSHLIQIITLFWFVTFFYLPIGFWYGRKMTRPMKLVLLSGLFFDLLFWLNQGTTKGIGDIVICYFSVFVLKRAIISRKKSIRWGQWGAIGLGILFFLFFSISQYQRLKFMGVKADSNTLIASFREFADIRNDGFLNKNLEPVLRVGVILSSTYLTHGYYGLAGCLKLPFEWTYGLGFSRAAMDYGEQYFGLNRIWEKHYLFRNEMTTGWPSGGCWSTAFPWFASDVTFFGVPLILLLIGMLIANAVCKVLYYQDPISLALIWQLAILVIYLPANNQIFQSRQSLLGSLALLGLFLIKSKPKQTRTGRSPSN
jgi:hypothetical protein